MLKEIFINIVLILYFIIYELPISTFNNFKNRKRDRYLKNILDEKFKDLKEEETCLMLCQYFKCNDKKLFKIIEIVKFNNIKYTLIKFNHEARINTEGLCFWRGNVKKHVVMAGTHDLNGGINRNFVI